MYMACCYLNLQCHCSVHLCYCCYSSIEFYRCFKIFLPLVPTKVRKESPRTFKDVENSDTIPEPPGSVEKENTYIFFWTLFSFQETMC